jgi:hypothetical protein
MENPPLEFNNMYVQKIIQGNMTLFRGYVNGYYWNKYNLKDPTTRNLGYYNTVQTDISNYFRGLMIDWLMDIKNRSDIQTNLVKYMNTHGASGSPAKNFIVSSTKNINKMTNGYVELYILNKINEEIPIIVSNTDNEPVYVFDKNFSYNKYESNAKISTAEKYLKDKKSVHLRYDNISVNRIPESIDVILMK